MLHRLRFWVAGIACITVVLAGSAGARTTPATTSTAAHATVSASLQDLLGVLPSDATPLDANSPERSAGNSTTYQDALGENPAAPDISTIVVSNNDVGALSFRINVTNRPTLTGDMLLLLFADTDANSATGDLESLGADYVLQVFGGDVALFRWDGSDFTRNAGDPPATSVTFAYQSGLTLGISAAELGNTKRFGFAAIVIGGVAIDPVTSDLDFTNSVSDVAPAAGAGLYQYVVLLTPPPPPKPPPVPTSNKTYESASRLPSRIRYVGKSIKHVRLGEKLYRTMKTLAKEGVIRVPKVVAVACWSKTDWLSVTESFGYDGNPNLLSGFWLGRQPRWVHIAPKECTDVQSLMLTRALNGQRAYALATVLHERVHAEGVTVEAETNCYAVQLVYDFARELNFVHQKALRLEQLAVRKSRAVAPSGYWNRANCRDGGKWDLYSEFTNLSY